jgi:6-phosphogluconolactonase
MAGMVTGNREVLVFADYEQMVKSAVEKWLAMASAAIAHEGRFTVALSGGKTPLGFYRELAHCNQGIAWEKMHIFLADERFVPFDDEASNYRMIKENLLDSVAVPAENIHPIATQETTPALSAQSYEDHLRDFFKLRVGERPTFYLIMLGIGEDGHTASLFPDTVSWTEKNRLVVAVRSEKLVSERISLSLPVINNAKNIIFLVSGKKKARIIKEILEENNESVPAALVRSEQGTTMFLLDADAGRDIAVVDPACGGGRGQMGEGGFWTFYEIINS